MFQSASHNTPIRAKRPQAPKIGIDGLLRLVTTVARIQASQPQTQQENPPCQSEKLPPVHCPRDNQSVAESALAPSPTPDLDFDSDVGKSDGSTTEAGA